MIYDSRAGFLHLKALRLKDEIEIDEIKKLIDYIEPLMNIATDRNTININNYHFYFIKLLTSRGIKFQNDVLTKDTIKTNGLKVVLYLGGILGTCFTIYNYISPDTTVKIAGLVAAGVRSILNRTNTLINYGFKTSSEYEKEESGTLNNKDLDNLKDLCKN